MEGRYRSSGEIPKVIVLDTNIISEIMSPRPERQVARWLGHQPLDSLWLTSVTVFEVQFGLELMSPGRKLRERTQLFDRLIEEKLKGRIAAFDVASALHTAKFAAARRSAGRPVAFRDIELAGIVSARSATLATRNIRDFDGFSINVVNPWDN